MIILREDFTDPAGTPPDPSRWTFRTGNWKPGTQVYSGNQAKTDGQGNLMITADRSETGFVSSRIDTRGKVEFVPPVRVRASIKMPENGEGIVPAFWTMGVNTAWSNPTDWPECGEIDIVEYQSNHPVQDNSAVQHKYASITIHGPKVGTDPVQDQPFYRVDSKGNQVRALGKSDLRDGYHLYDLVWKPDRMLFSLDGVVVWDMKKADYEAKGGDWEPFSGAWPHYLLLNVAVNTGMTPNATATSPFPASMSVNWIEVTSL